jgi:AsmA protein
VKGNADLGLRLQGKYIASTNEMPDLGLNLRLRNGFIAHENARLPVSDLNGNIEIQLPDLDPEQLHCRVDSFSFRLDRDHFSARAESHGLQEPDIDLDASAGISLDNLKKALGFSGFDMGGRLDLDAHAKGKFSRKVVQTSLRKKDTVIASIPAFRIRAEVSDGSLRYPSVPEPVTRIFIRLQAECPDADYRHAVFRIDTLHAAMLNNYIRGRARVNAEKDLPLEADLQGLVNLDDIRKCYPMDSLRLSGLLKFDIRTAGKYAPERHLFPKTNGLFSMENASVQTSYYPHPVEQINIQARASDATGTLNGLHLSIKPASLVFEGKPFYFSGDFRQFDDLRYDILAKGYLDIGRIYQVFSRKDLAVSGIIRVQAAFRGKQSDAAAGRYDQLDNSGTLDIRNLRLTHDYFPKPFLISRGRFHFEQDKMWFDAFSARYGQSDLRLNGFLENAINYALGGSKTLSGNFDLNARNLYVDEFAAYAGPAADTGQQVPASKGVVMVPANLDLTLKAEVEQVHYNDIVLDHFNGGVRISQGGIELTQTGFGLIGTQISMNGKYSVSSPLRAGFDYHLQAKDFDIHRAYNEIKIFRDLVSSARYAQGIISLDYSLSGRLNENMLPVYPSLSGGGVLSVSKVKFNGWKLFNTVSSQTGKSELKDPDLSKIDIKSSIKNNLISIPRFRFKTGGFRIRVEGQTSFDNQINLKMRIGLPPLGIIGIPLRITGQADAPKIRVGNKDSEPLEEKEDEE